MLFPESTPPRRVLSPEEKARRDRKILELQVKHDRLPAACRGPIAEELAKLQQNRALQNVAGERKPAGLGLSLLAVAFLVGCTAEPSIFVKTVDGHEYIVAQNPNNSAGTGGVVHSESCPCKGE